MSAATRFLVLIACASCSSAYGASLVSFDFLAGGGSAGGSAFLSPQSVAAGLTASDLTRGSGFIANDLYAFSGRGALNTHAEQSPQDLTAAIAANSYVQLVVTPDSGKKLSLTTLSAMIYQQNVRPQSTVTLIYSLDNFATSSTAATFNPINDNWNGTIHSADLSAIPALQNVESAVTFRWYLHGFAQYEDRGFGGVTGNNTDIELLGTVADAEVIPLPASVAGGAGLLALSTLTRRTRR